MKRSEIQALLPNVFQQTLESEKQHDSQQNVLSLLIDIMQLLHSDIEQQLTSIEDFFNPCRTSKKEFLDYLVTWTDLDRLWQQQGNSNQFAKRDLLAQDCLQELIGSAAYLSQWRGTKKGLCQFLSIATGANNITILENINQQGVAQAFHFLVQIPESYKTQLKLIKTIIEQEKPVYISYEIEFIAHESLLEGALE